MKKFLILLSVLALLLIAGPAQADWTDYIPIPDGVNYIGLDFSDAAGIVTLKTTSGICVKYEIIDNEITRTKKCGDTNWTDFTRLEER